MDQYTPSGKEGPVDEAQRINVLLGRVLAMDATPNKSGRKHKGKCAKNNWPYMALPMKWSFAMLCRARINMWKRNWVFYLAARLSGAVIKPMKSLPKKQSA